MEKHKINTLFFTVIFIASLSFILGGCAKKPIEKSYWSNNGQSLPSFTGSKDGLQWTISNNSSYLFFSLETNNRQVERMVMFRGITLYLDPTGKKKKDTYLRYPYISNPLEAFRENRSRDEGESRTREFHSPLTAYWMHNNDGIVLNSAMQRSRFSYHISMDSSGFMDYQVRIPLNRIADAGYHSINELSVGIVVAQPDMGSRPDFRGRGGFGGGEGEGGDRGGFGGEGGGFGGDRGGFGGRGRRPPEGGEGERSGFHPVNVNIWFLTKLAQPS